MHGKIFEAAGRLKHHVNPPETVGDHASGRKARLCPLIADFKNPRPMHFQTKLPREESRTIFKHTLREPFRAGWETRI